MKKTNITIKLSDIADTVSISTFFDNYTQCIAKQEFKLKEGLSL